MSSLLPGNKVSSTLDVLYPVLRGLATLLIVAMCMTLFGMVGGLAYPEGGVGAVVGAVVGIVLSLTFGCCITGLWKNLLPEDTKTWGIGALLPHSLAVQIGAHGNFEVIVTIHEAVGIEVQGQLPWRKADTYIEVECGQNPVKRTCVKNDGKFNEQFKFQVTAADENMIVRLKDQDIFGASDIGYVYVDIQKDIIGEGFPWRKEFPVEAGENDRLRYGNSKAYMVLSFDYTEDYPPMLRTDDKSSQKARQDMESQSQNYGAVSFLTNLEFNTNVKMAKEEDSFRTQDRSYFG